MIKIRWNTFESNSSSSHVVTIGENINVDKNRSYDIDFDYGEYGWEVECRSLQDYFYTSLCMGLKDDNKLDKETLDVIMMNIKDALSQYVTIGEITYEIPDGDDYYWGIDHDGQTGIAWDVIDSDTYEVKDAELLARMLFSSESFVYTGNDNDEYCDPRCGIVGKPNDEYDEDEERELTYRYPIDYDLVYRD